MSQVESGADLTAAPAVAAEAPAEARSPAYSYYVVGVLMLAYMFAFIDRMILSLVIDPVREDLGLTETQISLLVGFAFAAFYTLLGLPFGRWVDTRGRRNLMAIGIALWSLATAACGLANSFWRLFAARMAVGVGEATLAPAAYSMIPDYFPPHRLGFAMALFSCGVTLGGGLAMLIGGYIVQWAATAQPVLPLLGQVAAWKVAFLAVGPPGMIVALLIALTVKEPPRRLEANGKSEAPSVRQVVSYLWGNWRTFAPVFFGFTGLVVAGYAFNVWAPAYFMRVHGLSPAQVGLVFAAGLGVAGTLGVLSGGAIADMLARRGRPEAALTVSIGGALVQGPLLIACYLCPSTPLAIGLFVAGLYFSAMYGGLQAAAVQSLTPNRMRGQVGALYLTTANLIGLGLAPTATAMVTEQVFGGGTGIGPSLALTTGVALTFGVILLAIARPGARRRILALRAG